MQREVLSWVFTGIAVVIVVGLCVALRPSTKPEQLSLTPAYQPPTPPIPSNLSLVSLQGDASTYAFGNDEQRVYFARHHGAVIEAREYAISNKTERTLARFQVPNGLSVDEIFVDENGQVVALLTPASGSQSIKIRAVVIAPRGRAKTITYRLPEGCFLEAIAKNGAAIAGHYMRTVRHNPFEMRKIEMYNPRIFEPKQYQIPAPYFERATPDLRVSEPYTDDYFTQSMDIPEPGNEVSRKSYHRVRRGYTPRIRYFPDFSGGGGDLPPPEPPYRELYRDPFTFTEQYLFCSAKGRMRSTKVNWDGDCVVIGVSDSGNTVVGNYSHKNRRQGFIWRAGTGIRTLRYPGSQRTQLSWLSPQGDLVLGLAAISGTKTLLFCWSRRGGYKRLGEIPANIDSVSIRCVAPRGQAVLLEQLSDFSEYAYFVWSEQLGFRKSKQLRDILTEPLCISNSGKQILGKTRWGVSLVKVE